MASASEISTQCFPCFVFIRYLVLLALPNNVYTRPLRLKHFVMSSTNKSYRLTQTVIPDTSLLPSLPTRRANDLCCLRRRESCLLKDQYGPRTFFLEFPFFAKNMIIKSILNLWWHSKILKLFLGVVRGIFTKRLKRTRRLLYTVKYDFFQMTALHSKC